MPKKEEYASDLDIGAIDKSTVNNLLEFMKSKGMSVEKYPEEILKQSKYRPKLEYWVCRGDRNWEGLIVGFPGKIKDLSTVNVGTPYIRKTLYPMLVLHRRLKSHYSQEMPCLYLLGARFNDVFLRKFSLLKSHVPNVIVLSGDLKNWFERVDGHVPRKIFSKNSEKDFQKSLCKMMDSKRGLMLPLSSGKKIHLGLISYEVPTVAGTIRNEQLDILGYDLQDHSLVVFEIKVEGNKRNRPELENLFTQGMEHRNWVERNKMAVKFAFEGPRGSLINLDNPVKLILGFEEEKSIELFPDLKSEAQQEDRLLQIEFCRLIKPIEDGENVRIGNF